MKGSRSPPSASLPERGSIPGCSSFWLRPVSVGISVACHCSILTRKLGPGIHYLHLPWAGVLLGFSQSCRFSGLTLLSSFGFCLWPHLLLHETCFPRFLVMLLMLPHHGQGGIRLLFIPKEGLIPSPGSHRLGALGPIPILWYWELPVSLFLGGQPLLM